MTVHALELILFNAIVCLIKERDIVQIMLVVVTVGRVGSYGVLVLYSNLNAVVVKS